MAIDCRRIDPEDLPKYSYNMCVEVINELEKVSISKIADMLGPKGLEESEHYRSLAIMIKKRIDNDEFNELKSITKKKEKEILQHRLITLISNFDYSFNIAKLHVQLTNITTDYTQKKGEIENEVKRLGEKTDKYEHEILTHVLTLMGVFTAIITIIMSVVITSSSWLNNASNSSAVLAFIVPNLVTLFAIVVLLSFVYLYTHDHKVPEETTRKSKNKKEKLYINVIHKHVSYIVIVFSMIVSISLVLISVTYRKESNIIHSRIILSPGEYIVKDEIITPASIDGAQPEEQRSFFQFSIEDKTYLVEYDESLTHNGNLYFCQKHGTLE